MEAVSDVPDRDEVTAALRRLLSHPDVGANARRTKLLSYLVTEALAGREERLKGTSIAIDVFGRTTDFDPSNDAVVRIETLRLRQALASYYIGVGAEDPIVISIPKGRYVPNFTRRAGTVPSPASAKRVASDDDALVHTLPSLSGEAIATRGRSTGGKANVLIGHLAIPRSLIIGLTLLAGIVLTGWALSRAAPVAKAPLKPSVLVSPFEPVGTTEDLQVLASGMTSQFIADLMRFPNFRLYSFEDSLRAAQSTGIKEMGAETGADFLVRGIVRGDADTLSLIVQVVDTADASVVWSEAFVRPLEPSAIAALQAEISGEVAAKIGGPYGVVRDKVTKAIVSDDAGMSGFACVMRAHTYRHANRADLYATARACIEDLVLRDPDYAEAWALLAFLRLDGGRFGYEARTPEERDHAYAIARAAAARALALEPENELATSALAMIEHYAGRFEESLRYSQLAVQANPNDPSTLAYHGWRLGAQGRLEEGLPYVEAAIARSVNPQPTFFHVIAVDRLMAGDMEGMLVAAKRAAVDQSSVSDAFLAIAFGGLRAQDEADAALANMARKWPLLGQDPAAAFAWHNMHPDLITAIVEGLETAGWQPNEN